MEHDLTQTYLAKTAELLDAVEEKVRHVRDPKYWGLPYGTPITPGMKPGGKVPTTRKPSVSVARPLAVSSNRDITAERVAMWDLGEDLAKNGWYVNYSVTPWKAERSFGLSNTMEATATIFPDRHGVLDVKVEVRHIGPAPIEKDFHVFWENASVGRRALERRIKKEAQKLEATLKGQAASRKPRLAVSVPKKRPKNPMGRTTTIDKPHQVWEGAGGWKWLILKSYQTDNNKPYARAFCAVSSPYTMGDYEYGDVYWDEIRSQAVLTQDNTVK